MTLVVPLDRCLLCGSAELHAVVSLEPVPIATPAVQVPEALRATGAVFAGVPLRLNLCRACGQVQVSHRADAEFEYRNFVYRTASSIGLHAHFRAYAEDVLASPDIPAAPFAVEIGSNDGTLLGQLRARGARVLGIDPAVAIANEATAAGLPTLPEFFTAELAAEIRREHGPADVVIANFVSANVADMETFGRGLRTLVRDEGLVFVETQYGADVVDGNLLDTVYHEHLSYFFVAPLQRFYARHGLEIVDVRRVASKGGSIRLVLQPVGARRSASPAVDAFIADERARGMATSAFFLAWPGRIARIRSELRALVDEVATAGGRLAGWGVSLGTSTLLAQFGLGPAIAELYDDDSTKEPVLRGPGYAIPIRSTDQLAIDPPDAIVVFAWRYIAAIMERHADYVARGGRFIVPLPDVSVVSGAGARPPNTIGV